MSALPALAPVRTDDAATPAPVPPSRTYGAAAAPSCSGVERFVDGINLLQHLPGVSDAYRSVTGDRLCSGVRYFAAPLLDVFTGGPTVDGAPVPAEEAAAAAATPPAPGPTVAPIPVANTDAGSDAPQDLLRYLKAETSSAATEVAAETPALVTVAGTPVDLLRWLQPASQSGGPEPLGALDDPYGPVETIAGRPATPPTSSAHRPTSVPPAGLAEVATHPSNHLPLAVLEALQDRHRSLIAHERT